MGYRDGVHAPVGVERDPTPLRVAGTLPEALRGTFARNAPDDQFPPLGKSHWFDGDGMVHAVHFGDEGPVYRCRRTRTAALQAEAEAGHALWGGILHPVAPPGGPPLKDTANTHLVAHRGRLITTWWLSGRPLELDPVTLDTLGPPPFASALKRTVAAHPKVDPRTGELLFFGYQLHKPPFYWVGIASAEGELVRVEDVDVAGPRIPHDIGFTDRFVVLLDLPMGWDPAAMRAGKLRIGFDKEAPARIGLWPRSGGAVRWFDVPACYVYHLSSSYEDGETVVVTGCRIDDPIPAERREGVPHLDIIELAPVTTRWTLDLASGTARVETLDDHPTEFPRVNDATWGRQARFGYHPRVARTPELQFEGFDKLDYGGGRKVTRAYPDGWRGGEVVFAPRPGGTAEDDGWVLTMLTHPDEAASELWVLDAQQVDAEPVARVTLPWRVPLGFHAEWAPATS
ncbi:MAG: carotenoid oxygenase family protein [Myxococcota bacterium]